MSTILPTDKSTRKSTPMARGLLDYFPRALAAVANVSFVANEQHNPGEPMHWAKEKSADHADCAVRHLVERGSVDDDGLLHSAKLAWRALALLEMELEEVHGVTESGLRYSHPAGDGTIDPAQPVQWNNETMTYAVESSGHNTTTAELPAIQSLVFPEHLQRKQVEAELLDRDKCGTTDGVTPIPIRYNTRTCANAIKAGIPPEPAYLASSYRWHWIVRGEVVTFVTDDGEFPGNTAASVFTDNPTYYVQCDEKGEAL